MSRKSGATLKFILLSTIFLIASSVAQATESNFASRNFTSPYVITIKSVYLKNDGGKWVKIIEPDRRVDLSKEEPVIQFFNNGGRVPGGAYKNFRIDFLGEDSGALKSISSKNDFQKSVSVNKGSFIRVSFDLLLNRKIEVEEADVTVDADSRQFISNSLLMEA